MDKQTEYQALREEILGSIQVVKSYRSFYIKDLII